MSLLLEPAQTWGRDLEHVFSRDWASRYMVYGGEGDSEAQLLAAVPGEALDHPLDHLISLPSRIYGLRN